MGRACYGAPCHVNNLIYLILMGSFRQRIILTFYIQSDAPYIAFLATEHGGCVGILVWNTYQKKWAQNKSETRFRSSMNELR